MIHTQRNTDHHAGHFSRCDRLFLQTGLWYFRIREGAPIGPFRYRSEAETMLGRFIGQVRQAHPQHHAGRPKPHFRTNART